MSSNQQTDNLGTLLTTKFERPKPSVRIVQRPRLLTALTSSSDRCMTLLVAPTGYGKTTLLLDWLSSDGYSGWKTVWITLDSYNNLPLNFWAYFVSGIKNACPQIRVTPQELIQRWTDPQDPSALNPLINELADISDNLIMVLDDFHTIKNNTILEGLGYFIDHCPENFHLVISSRTAPQISLSRLHVQGKLVNITEKDLAFTTAEARTFLSDVMSLEMPSDQFNWLMDVTEGWVSGLQIGALSYSVQPNKFLLGPEVFSDNRLVYDYLSEEVLNQQDGEVKEFLLKTSILDELTAPLCDMMLDREKSQDILSKIEAANLFLISLDERNRWYRYHSLFADSLFFHLKSAYPNEIEGLHQRAYAWLVANGFSEKAIKHALAIGDLESAAGIIENCAVTAINEFDLVKLTRWLSHFSDELYIKRPSLGVYKALANYYLGYFDQVELNLKVIEEILDENPIHLLPEPEIRVLRWEISVIKAALENYRNQKTGLEHLERVKASRPTETSYFYGFLNHSLAKAYTELGKLNLAYETYITGYKIAVRKKLKISQIHSLYEMGRLRQRQGRLLEARQDFTKAIKLSAKLGLGIGMASLPLAGLVDLQLEQNEEIRDHDLIVEITRQFYSIIESPSLEAYKNFIGLRFFKYFLSINDPHLASSFLPVILDFLTEPNPYEVTFPLRSSDVKLLSKMKSEREDLVPNMLRDFENWLEKKDGLSSSEQIVLARINYLHENVDKAQLILAPLVQKLRKTEERENLLEALVLIALSHQTLGRDELAIDMMEEAIELGESAGYFRLLINEGKAAKTLLRKLLKQLECSNGGKQDQRKLSYLRKLLAAFELQGGQSPLPHQEDETASSPELLSDREIEIFDMLVQGKSYKEIAKLLVISHNTVKIHIRHIYTKLDVHTRRELYQYEDAVSQMKRNA